MIELPLEDVLQALTREHGFEEVHACLHRLQATQTPLSLELQPRMPLDMGYRVECKREIRSAAKGRHRKATTTAMQYVVKMELPLEKRQLLDEVARKFEEKSFLPTFGDISNFCQVYQIDTPASRTRASAIPRVFKFIASMETKDVRAMLDDGMFSGPSRLGPIADAIRQSGRRRNAGAISRPLGEE